MTIAVHPTNQWCRCRAEVSTPNMASAILLLEEFLALDDQKALIIENYAVFNKRKVLRRRIRTLETRQIADTV